MTQGLAHQISGIYETHLTVADLPRAVAFYRDVLGLELAHEVPSRGIVFFWVGARDQGMLGLWQGSHGPLQMLGHFAFRMSRQGVLDAPATLRNAGVQPLGFHGEPVTEPVVLGWMPAVSLYFKDPDGHSLECIHVLPDAPDPGFGIGPWSAWQARAPAR
jgi:lactoylglutathione lyase